MTDSVESNLKSADRLVNPRLTSNFETIWVFKIEGQFLEIKQGMIFQQILSNCNFAKNKSSLICVNRDFFVPCM